MSFPSIFNLFKKNPQPPKPNYWEVLPEGPRLTIFRFLSGDELLSLSAVCKLFRGDLANDVVWKDFAQKKGVSLTSSEDWKSAKSQVFAYTKIFLKLFPEAALKTPKPKKFSKNHPMVSFEAQWEAIRQFINANPEKLSSALIKSEDIKTSTALFDVGTKIDKGWTKLSIVDEQIRQLFFERGYPSTHAHIQELYALRDTRYNLFNNTARRDLLVYYIIEAKKYQFTVEDIKAAIEQNLWEIVKDILTAKNVQPDLFPHALKHFRIPLYPAICKHFLSLGYQFTKEDLKAFADVKWNGPDFIGDKRINELLDQILVHINAPVTLADVKWAILRESYRDAYGSIHSKVLQKIVSLYEQPLSSELFQLALENDFSPKTVEIFLKKSYQISSSDFKYIIDKLKKREEDKERRVGIYFSDVNPDVLLQIISEGKIKIDNDMVIGGGFKPSREDFHYLLENWPSSGIIKNILKNGYQVNSEDFRKAIDANLNFLDMQAFLNQGHSTSFRRDIYPFENKGGYLPSQEDFQYCLKKECSPCILEEIIIKGYKVTKEDFLLALDKNCSEKSIQILLNIGSISQGEKSYAVYENGGFNPSKDERQFALSRGASPEILDLMRKRNPDCLDK